MTGPEIWAVGLCAVALCLAVGASAAPATDEEPIGDAIGRHALRFGACFLVMLAWVGLLMG